MKRHTCIICSNKRYEPKMWCVPFLKTNQKYDSLVITFVCKTCLSEYLKKLSVQVGQLNKIIAQWTPSVSTREDTKNDPKSNRQN